MFIIKKRLVGWLLKVLFPVCSKMRFCRTDGDWVGSGDTWCGNCPSAPVSPPGLQPSLSCHSSRYKLQSNLHFRYKMARCQFSLPWVSDPPQAEQLTMGLWVTKEHLGDQVSATMVCKVVFTARETEGASPQPQVGHSYHEVTSTI